MAEATDHIGPYRILARIGEGGMGTVYQAQRSDAIEQTVAIKLIKRGMDSRDLLERFQTERRSLARMEHDSIAKVFDAGETETGQPYFVMEFVEGASLVDYCDAHRLTVPARLELLRDVCKAVQHAHAKGVVHRDLKPSNILVTERDGRPVPKIIDFGLARATDDDSRADLTRIGQAIGSPQYMSPEQTRAGHDVDTRTDVYALGVLLFESLTGRVPFGLRLDRDNEDSSLDELLARIRDEDPRRPSQVLQNTDPNSLRTLAEQRSTAPRNLARLCRGDLDWITLRALEKDPERRYASPDALADEIERHLNDEPVDAGPPTFGYRLSKFVRKNRLQVGATAAIVILGVVAAILLIGQDLRLRAALASEQASTRARELADQRRDLEAERRRAAENLRRSEAANAAVRQATAQARAGEWTAALASLDEAERSGYPDPIELEIARVGALEADARGLEANERVDALAARDDLGAHRAKVLLLQAERVPVDQIESVDALVSEALELSDAGRSPLAPVDRALAEALVATDLDSCRRALRQVVLLDPRHRVALVMLAQIQLFSGEAEESRDVLEQLRFAYPNGTEQRLLDLVRRALVGDAKSARADLNQLEIPVPEAALALTDAAVGLLSIIDEHAGAVAEQSAGLMIGDPFEVSNPAFRLVGAVTKIARSVGAIDESPTSSELFRLAPVLGRVYGPAIERLWGERMRILGLFLNPRQGLGKAFSEDLIVPFEETLGFIGLALYAPPNDAELARKGVDFLLQSLETPGITGNLGGVRRLRNISLVYYWRALRIHESDVPGHVEDFRASIAAALEEPGLTERELRALLQMARENDAADPLIGDILSVWRKSVGHTELWAGEQRSYAQTLANR